MTSEERRELMREIVDQVLAQLATREGFALVTLVSERGSTPRAAGAQMLVRADGSIAGTIGGGLLEATMMSEAAAVIAERRSRVTTMGLAGRSIESAEMLCGGRAEVLIAYVPPEDPELTAVCAGVAAAVCDARRAWLFTFFSASETSSSVRYCLLDEEGEAIGELPCAGSDLRRLIGKIGVHGSAALPDGRQVHAEAIEIPARAVICGAGHVARALAPIAESAGFQTLVLDDRPEFANKERFPSASRVVVLESFSEAFADVAPDEHSFVIIVTRGHQHDTAVLMQALRTPARYIGLMSSRTKWKRIQAALLEVGFTAADIERVHSPVGLAIGAETPGELAISIVAEMIQVRAEGV